MKFVFKVTFIPKARWVDEIYLGNMLIEVLAALRDRQNAFDFEVTRESVEQ